MTKTDIHFFMESVRDIVDTSSYSASKMRRYLTFYSLVITSRKTRFPLRNIILLYYYYYYYYYYY